MGMSPMQFQPSRYEVNDVSLDVHNKVVEELAAAREELNRCHQKVAHLLKELEAK